MRHQAPGWENKIFPESKGLRIVEHVQKMRKQIADIGKTFTFRECCPQFVSKGKSQVQAPNHDTKITAILQNFFLHRILDHASCLNKASPHCAYIIWYGYGPKPCNPWRSTKQFANGCPSPKHGVAGFGPFPHVGIYTYKPHNLCFAGYVSRISCSKMLPLSWPVHEFPTFLVTCRMRHGLTPARLDVRVFLERYLQVPVANRTSTLQHVPLVSPQGQLMNQNQWGSSL